MTAEHLSFGLAKERGDTQPVYHLDHVVVKTCYASGTAQETLWLATREVRDGGHPPTSVVYGSPPPGFTSRTPSRPLPPGCYEASVSGNGISSTARFTVRSDGLVREDRPDRSE